MEYIFGSNGERETLKTKGSAHTDFSGYQQTVREYPDRTVIDSFRLVRKAKSEEDSEGNCYDWYEIDQHYRYMDTGGILTRQNAMEEANAIVFVTLAESGGIDDVTASEHADLFSPWAYPVNYTVGQIRKHAGKLYKCLNTHTSQADWTPDAAPSLWVAISDPADEWPEWSQPVGAHDAYNIGDKVSHNEKKWTSTCDGNVWEPGVYGWEEVTELP